MKDDIRDELWQSLWSVNYIGEEFSLQIIFCL